ncbi:hypothetical protein, partial [Aeromonas caviae]|uniref:hypothetical protein n=1 Tax=Aeromonas caviae TaxID=648 RepID=UPI0029D9B606
LKILYMSYHHALTAYQGHSNLLPNPAQAGFFDPSSLFLSQIRRSLRRFYASQIGLYGAFTPVLHTLSASMRPMGSTRICIDP